MNIPAIGERSLRRHIASTQFSTGSEIQVNICYPCKSLSDSHTDRSTSSACWWIKADGCDIVSGLEESLRSEWNGGYNPEYTGCFVCATPRLSG